MSNHLKVVGLGEALFDVFPERTVLGGAPLNVAVMADQLLSRVGGSGFGGNSPGEAFPPSIFNRMGRIRPGGCWWRS